MGSFNRAIPMSADLQYQQAAHELIRMLERMLSLSIDPGDRDASGTLEPDDLDRFGLMVARLGRMAQRLEVSEEGLALRLRHRALEQHLASMRG